MAMNVEEALEIARGERCGQWSAVVPVLAGEVERLRGIEARLDAAIEDAFPDGKYGQADLIAVRDGT